MHLGRSELDEVLCLAYACCVVVLFVAHAQEFRLLAWNVESNRPSSPAVSDPKVIARQLTELLSAADTKSQIVALSEVDPKTFLVAYRDAIGKGLGTEVDFVTSASGVFKIPIR